MSWAINKSFRVRYVRLTEPIKRSNSFLSTAHKVYISTYTKMFICFRCTVKLHVLTQIVKTNFREYSIKGIRIKMCRC